jgi:hypothetical protein
MDVLREGYGCQKCPSLDFEGALNNANIKNNNRIMMT